jgi:2-methylfumaryl-CoA isomerase
MDYENLKARRDDVIMVTVLGTREGGPAVDYTVNPALGFPHATGPEGSDDPVCHVLPAWDCITGQTAAIGLLAAERHRRMTGQGQEVDIALKDVGLAMLGNLGIVGEVMVNEQTRPKYGNSLYGAYGETFTTADGERVMVVGLTRRQWDLLRRCTGLGDELDALAAHLALDFTSEGDRFRARHEISAVLAPWFAARRVEDFASEFDEAGVTWSVFRTFDQAVRTDDGFSTDGPLYSMVEQPGIGTYPVPGSPLDFSAVPRAEPRRAARLGEHTDQILSGVLGLSDNEISALRERSIVGGPRA